MEQSVIGFAVSSYSVLRGKIYDEMLPLKIDQQYFLEEQPLSGWMFVEKVHLQFLCSLV